MSVRGGQTMEALEAIETINSWRRVLIEGRKEDVDRVLVEIERRLQAKGWNRSDEMENIIGLSPVQRDRIRCFVGGPPTGPKLMLGLTRVSDRRVRGFTYSLLDNPQGTQPVDVA